MENTWLSIEDDSSHCASDSDVIDSETEAELYSTIHYEENINFNTSKSVNFENIDAAHSRSAAVILSPQNNNISEQEKLDCDYSEINSNSLDGNTCLDKFKCEANPAKKLKPDSDCIISNFNLDSDDFENDSNESYKHKFKKNSTQQISNTKQSPRKRNAVDDSTDSDDSIIWTELDSLENSDFTTNLSREDEDSVRVVLSDSDSDFPSRNSPTFMRRESVLKNLSMPNIKVGEKHEGQWYINSEDLYRSRKYSRRYHTNIDLVCTNCNKKGHNFKICSEPKVLKCFICGDNHLGSRCTNRICGTCFQYGHDRRRCRWAPNCFLCEICSRPGHVRQNCPDLWRRYHLTTESLQIVRGKKINQDSNVYCWNCGQYGHFGGVCQSGFSRNTVNTWPCVISYNDPTKMFRRNRQNNSRWNEQVQYRENVSVTPDQRNRLLPPSKCASKRKCRRMRKKVERLDMKVEKLDACKNNPDLSARKIKSFEKKIKNTRRKIDTLVRAKDFPRSPKKNITPTQQPDETPKYVEDLRRKELKRERLKLKKQIKRQRKFMENAQNLQTVL